MNARRWVHANMSDEVCDNKNYRVSIHPTTNEVDILCFGLEAIDASALGLYGAVYTTHLCGYRRG
jgi:hypothetical protein